MFRHELFPFSSDDAGRSEPAIPLAQQLREARDGLRRLVPPPHVLPQLLDAFEQLRHTQVLQAPAASAKPSLRQRGWLWLARLSPLGVGGPDAGGDGPRWATACLLAMTVGLIVLMQPGMPGAPSQDDAWAGPGFVPLVPTSSMARTGAAWLVHTELSHANLASLGAPFDPSRASDTVQAELLVNARGDVLAVRLP